MVSNRPLPSLKAYRANRGITQDALAKELGVHSLTVSRWETGERKIDDELVPKVSEITGIPALELRPDLAALIGGTS